MKVAASFARIVRSRVINQHSTHNRSRYTDEVLMVLPVGAIPNHTHIGLVDQRSRLQRVVLAFMPHVPLRKGVQFVVDEGKELIRRSRVATLHGIQQDRHFADISAHRENRLNADENHTTMFRGLSGILV
jgi:hypothetical protein